MYCLDRRRLYAKFGSGRASRANVNAGSFGSFTPASDPNGPAAIGYVSTDSG